MLVVERCVAESPSQRDYRERPFKHRGCFGNFFVPLSQNETITVSSIISKEDDRVGFGQEDIQRVHI